MDPPLMQHPSTFLDCDTFEKQVVHLLGCSLDTVTRQQYDDLVSQSESTWPCHQQSFIKSVKEYIHSFRSNFQPIFCHDWGTNDQYETKNLCACHYTP